MSITNVYIHTCPYKCTYYLFFKLTYNFSELTHEILYEMQTFIYITVMYADVFEHMSASLYTSYHIYFILLMNIHF